MLPNIDQIRRAAYDLWLSRGQVHGYDRDDWHAAEDELTFSLNYRTLVEYPLDGPGMLVLGDRRSQACRYCEQGSPPATFSVPREVVPGMGARSLMTLGVCDHCQSDCLDSLAAEAIRFWKCLSYDRAGLDVRVAESAAASFTPAVFKSLVAGALLTMPESELSYFVDTLEWVSNPDHTADGSLFMGLTCRLYVTPRAQSQSRISLARRLRDDLPLPYMLCFVARGRIVVQFQVPLCIRDADLDGRPVRAIERPFIDDESAPYERSRSWVISLAPAGARRN
jgi:Protein of unknown function (DUF2934)